MSNTQTLDARTLSPVNRLSTILGTYKALNRGDTLLLTNNHNPVPLKAVLQTQSPDGFEWVASQLGPEEWQVRITKNSNAEINTGSTCCGSCGG